MSDIRKTLDKLNEMTAGSVATVATPLFKETVKREKTDETADSGKKYMNSVQRGASEWGNWAGSKKKKTVAEATNPTTDDDKFKKMLQTVTSKKAVNKQKKADTKQKASDAFASMFGGGNPAGTLGIRKESVEEGLEQQYLWHGSRQKIPMLEPRQSIDTGGAAGSNQNAIYATSDPKVAIAMGLTTPGSDTGMFPNDPQMVLFSGKIRKGENVYLHKVPMNGPDGKPQFVQGGNSREFHSVPGVKGIKPIEIKAVPVDKYLNLIRQATPQDLELRKKYMKQGVEEGFEKNDQPLFFKLSKNGAFDVYKNSPNGPYRVGSITHEKNGLWYGSISQGSMEPLIQFQDKNLETVKEKMINAVKNLQLKTAIKLSEMPNQDVDEGWKEKVAGAALAAAAMGAFGNADAKASHTTGDEFSTPIAGWSTKTDKAGNTTDRYQAGPIDMTATRNAQGQRVHSGGTYQVNKTAAVNVDVPYKDGQKGIATTVGRAANPSDLDHLMSADAVAKRKGVDPKAFARFQQGLKEQDVEENWKISTPIDKERYTDMSDQGLEGPFRLKSGKIVYYDPKEGKYYDRDTDMYMDYDEYQSHTNEEALMELGYEGNVGAMEMVKFFKMADPRQKEILNQLIKEKEFQRAWALIQGVTGDKLVGKEFSEGEIAEQLSEDLRAWFGKGGEGGAGGGGWDRYNTKGERIGKCGERKAGEGKPKCLSKEKAASLRASGGKKAIAAAVRKKRREDPNPQRQGKADMVSNKTKNESLEYYVKEGICPQCNGEMVSEALFTEGKKDACYHKVKSRYKIWPSAYASGALVKCRKAGAKNWGNKSKNESINEGRADDLERALMQARKITKGIAYDNTVNEIMVEIENLVKAYALDMDDFNYHNSRVYEAKHELESAIYGLDEIFEDALRDAKFSDEESINEADPARRGFLGSLGKAAAAGAAMAAGGKALGQEKRSVNISVEEADNQIKALRNQAYQDLASMVWSVWPYILDKKFGNVTPEDDIPNAEEIGKIISNRIGRKLEEYAREYRKKVHMIKVNAGITDPNTLYKTSAMLESLTEDDLSEQDLIVMPGKMRMRGDVVKAKHMEPDHEVSMAVNSLLSTVKSAMSLAKIIKGRSEGQGLPGWVSDHITRADELIKDVAEYMEGHEAQKNMLEGKKNVKR